MKTLSVVLFALAAAFVVNAPQQARADERTVCAMYMPCNPDGSVWEEARSGECADYYQAVCAKQAASQISDDLVSCSQEKEKLTQSNADLAKQLHKIKARLARARR